MYIHAIHISCVYICINIHLLIIIGIFWVDLKMARVDACDVAGCIHVYPTAPWQWRCQYLFLHVWRVHENTKAILTCPAGTCNFIQNHMASIFFEHAVSYKITWPLYFLNMQFHTKSHGLYIF